LAHNDEEQDNEVDESDDSSVDVDQIVLLDRPITSSHSPSQSQSPFNMGSTSRRVIVEDDEIEIMVHNDIAPNYYEGFGGESSAGKSSLLTETISPMRPVLPMTSLDVSTMSQTFSIHTTMMMHSTMSPVRMKELSQQGNQKECYSEDTLQDIRIGEVKRLEINTKMGDSSQRRMISKLANKGLHQLQASLIDPQSGTEIDPVASIDCIAEVHANTFIVTFIIRIDDNANNFHPAVYGKRRICLQSIEHHCTLWDREVMILPATVFMPFKSFSFWKGGNGIEIEDPSALVTISFTSLSDWTTVEYPRDYSGQSVNFPEEIQSDGIVAVEFISSGHYPRIVKYVYLRGELHDEDTRIAVCPTDLSVGEMRVVLTWRSKPSDLDMKCFVPAISHGEVSSTHRNVGNRKNAHAAMIEFEMYEGDEREGFGPESIVCSPMQNTEYRFFVYKWSQDEKLSNSGAMVTIFKADGEVEEIRISSEDWISSEELERSVDDGISSSNANYWYVFDVMEQEVQVVNELTSKERKLVNHSLGW
jgi:hypothetical protein